MIDPQKFRPPHVLLSLYAAAVIFNLLLRPPRLIEADLAWAGWLLAVGGFGMMIFAISFFKRHGTPVRHSEKPQRLVTDGPFRLSRNPMYIGGLIMLVGIAVLAGTWPFWGVPVAMFFMLRTVFIPWEEKTMEALFGEEYRRYRARTRRWL